jgi:hypothetical protein
MVVGYGGFLTSEANFYIVDLDARTVRRIEINHVARVKGQVPDMRQVVWLDRSADLSPDEINPLIEQANRVWKQGVSDKPQLQPLDSIAALTLLDGDLVFYDKGTSTHAPDNALSLAIHDLAQKRELTRDPGAATDLPCDPAPIR